MPLVIDASAILPLALSDEDAAYATCVLLRLQDESQRPRAPCFFDELQNVLLYAERDARIDQSVSELFVRRVLEDLPLVVCPIVDRFAVMQVARDHNLTFYDASYLSLAIANKCRYRHTRQEIDRGSQSGTRCFTLNRRLRELESHQQPRQ